MTLSLRHTVSRGVQFARLSRRLCGSQGFHKSLTCRTYESESVGTASFFAAGAKTKNST